MVIEDLLIVAAGMGTRLKSKGNLKPLVEVQGRPLIEYALGSAFYAGLRRATVVTGYAADILESGVREICERKGWDVQFVRNPDYKCSNGLSVLAAREALGGRRFCLAMSDHIVDPLLYQRLLASRLIAGEVALGVDMRLNNPFVDLKDVTKVRQSGPFIRDIGKDISLYTGFDTGVFCADDGLMDAILASGRKEGDFSISGGVKVLAREGRALGVNVGDAFWIDVDSPGMHTMASDWVRLSQSATA